MADGSYQPKVYRKQGGAEQVIASGGQQTVESGGVISVQSGGALNMDAGATMKLPFVAEAEGSTMSAYGISSIGGTSAHSWNIDAPVAGAFKIIAINAASTSAAQTIYSGSSGITFDGTNDTLTIESPAGLTLVGLSATRWHIASRQLAVASSSEFAASVAST